MGVGAVVGVGVGVGAVVGAGVGVGAGAHPLSSHDPKAPTLQAPLDRQLTARYLTELPVKPLPQACVCDDAG